MLTKLLQLDFLQVKNVTKALPLSFLYFLQSLASTNICFLGMFVQNSFTPLKYKGNIEDT